VGAIFLPGPQPAHGGPGVRLQALNISVKVRPHLSFANRNLFKNFHLLTVA
jgi:hypothetical protein